MAPQKYAACLALAICPQLLLAADCPAGAKPFPPHLIGKGRVDYANLFDISYRSTYKVISFSPTLATYNSYHPTKAGQPIPPIVLYQCGTPKPDYLSEDISSGARFFEIPLQRASLAWGGAVPFFEMLGLTEFIHAIDMTYISAPCVQLMEVCYPGIHMKGGSDEFKTHHQRMTPSNGSVVFTDSFGTGYSDSAWDIEFMVSVDPGILNRAEWVNFVAAFFNEEAQGAQIFSKISSDYNAMRAFAIQLGGDDTTEWGGRQPLVAWTDSQPETCPDPATNCGPLVGWAQVDGNWCHCGVLYKISTAHYKRDMVEDAGGRLLSMPSDAAMPDGCSTATNTDGSQTLTCDPSGHAAFVSLLAQVDVIFDESRIHGGSDSYDTSAHDFEGSYGVTAAEVPALARNPPNIFRLDGSVSDLRDGMRGSNWFEASRAQPQQLLAGMMEALWGNNFHSPCGNKYLRRAIPGEGQEVLGHDDCPVYDEGGNHDCAAIHELAHQIPQCMQGATVTPIEDYPLSYTNCGLENTVDTAPQRVITMTQGATEFLLALGLHKQMVGTAYLDDYIWPKYAKEYSEIPVLSSTYPDEATIMAASPDFIIANFNSAFREMYTSDDGEQMGIFSEATVAPCTGTGGEELGMSDEGSNDRTCRKELNSIGVSTFLFQDSCEDTSLRPEVVSEAIVYEEMRALGRIFKVDVEPLITEMSQDFDAARDLVSKTMHGTPLTAVWLDCVGRCCPVDPGEEPQVFVGAGAGVPAMLMQEAGLSNAFDDVEGNWACVPESQVVAAAPDVIVVVDAAWDTALSKIQWLFNHTDFCDLDALKGARFVQIPFSATSLSPRNGPAVMDLATASLYARTGTLLPGQESGVSSFSPEYFENNIQGLACTFNAKIFGSYRSEPEAPKGTSTKKRRTTRKAKRGKKTKKANRAKKSKKTKTMRKTKKRS